LLNQFFYLSFGDDESIKNNCLPVYVCTRYLI
jgi:hypothetical protein